MSLLIPDMSGDKNSPFMPAAFIACFGVGIVGLVMLRLLLRLAKPRTTPLPPGPPGEFLLGHYRVVPFEAPFKQYAKWGQEYDSDVLFFSAFGKKWIVLNSLKAAMDLLDKRGTKYSDRPRFVMWELMGWAPTLTWLRWGPKMQQHRRVLQPPFSGSRVGEHRPVQRREALRAVASMAWQPEKWRKAVRRFAAGVMLDISYGIELSGEDDPFIDIADDAAAAVGNAGAPAGSILDRFPMTRFLPAWLPFMERMRYANKWRSAIVRITDTPFETALKDVATPATWCMPHMQRQKVARRCFVQEQLEVCSRNAKQGIADDFTLQDIKGAAATILIAGSDTTASTVQLFVLYLMQNPRVQRKAQAEMDSVVGSSRLPDWDDMPRLPYLHLVLQECYRSNPLSPLGIPHASVEDDEYEGMFIPSGTIVYQNVWAMTHDPAVYRDPHVFLPERYLPPGQDGGRGRGEPFPTGNFGFGRRVCVGRHLAENSLFIMFATILATLDIGLPRGSDGRPVEEEVRWSFRGQAYPLPFRVSLTPRSDEAMELLMTAAAAAAS